MQAKEVDGVIYIKQVAKDTESLCTGCAGFSDGGSYLCAELSATCGDGIYIAKNSLDYLDSPDYTEKSKYLVALEVWNTWFETKSDLLPSFSEYLKEQLEAERKSSDPEYEEYIRLKSKFENKG